MSHRLSLTIEPGPEIQPGVYIGTDTFRGSLLEGTGLDATQTLRPSLYSKNQGQVTQDRTQLVRTESPISGSLLVSNGSVHQAVKDPMTGTTLKFKGGHAAVTTPVLRQELKHTKKFYITKDVDITIQMLRNTTGVSRATNEKIGTAGTSTGVNDLFQPR
mmetsp:Transcript_21337/g.59167  ORF Transcript_21337/g.59167 Transcript_21337/m.59167 type:complete len:160 (+) Transcript_21337:1930-2409(+)